MGLHYSSLVCIAGILLMCTLIWYLGFMGTFLFLNILLNFFNTFLLLSWMFEHVCLDTCCFGCLICICFVFASVQRN